MTRIVFTCGDINGIGPEIVVKTISRIFKADSKAELIFVCPQNVFELYYKITKATFRFRIVDKNSLSDSHLNLIRLPNAKLKIGYPTKTSGQVSFQSIKKSLSLIDQNFADVLVTAPISKEAFKIGKIDFPGHTELLAKHEESSNYMMLFLSGKIKIGLLTIHLPISEISNQIKVEKIIKAIELINITSKRDLGIKIPKIAVLALNPHAGENGLIGDEENKIIIPAIKSLQKKIDVSGPFVPDAFWGNKDFKKFDIILAMYHDQALIPFKLLNFNSGVNFTAGLKLIRTSPDHGTAYNIAGLNKADESSIYQSYKYAIKIFQNRNRFIAQSESY